MNIMSFVKKLVFTPFLLVSVIASVVFANQVLVDPLTAVIGFQQSAFITLLYLSISLVLAGLFYALIVTLAGSWEIPIFVGGFASLIPLLMIQEYPVNIIFAVGFFVSFIIGMVMLLQKLQSYLTFSPRQILAPSIGLMTLLFSLTISIAAYQTTGTKIEKEGFTIPDQLLNAAMELSGAKSLMGPTSLMEDSNVQGVETTAESMPAVNLSPEQIKFIQQNPSLLKQFNITPEQFNSFVKSQNSGTTTKKTNPTAKTVSPPPSISGAPSDLGENDLVKSLVKNQLNTAVKPYESFMAPLIAALVFSTITFGNFILGFFTPLWLWILFSIMEKSGFVHFVKEMREVKKLVV